MEITNNIYVKESTPVATTEIDKEHNISLVKKVQNSILVIITTVIFSIMYDFVIAGKKCIHNSNKLEDLGTEYNKIFSIDVEMKRNKSGTYGVRVKTIINYKDE